MKRLLLFICVILFLNTSAQLNFIYQINGGSITFSINPPQYYETVKWIFGDGTNTSGYNLNSVSHAYTMNANYTVCVIGYPMPIATIDTACKIISLSTVGIRENKLKELPIVFYPNPVKDKLLLEFQERIIDKISITNYLGQTVYVLDNPNLKQEIDLSPISNGIYFLTIYHANQKKYFKVIKE